MKPHIVRYWGLWLCYVRGTNPNAWMGVSSDSPAAAYNEWKRGWGRYV